MIAFDRVTDSVVTEFNARIDLLAGASATVPPGYYGLLLEDPRARSHIVDLLCGTRPPHRGSVRSGGRASWPIGRTTLFRGPVTGSDIVGMFCRLYDLDRSEAEGFVAELVGDRTLLRERSDRWHPTARAEFGLAVALLPRFDIYVTDGNVLFSRDRFGAIWRELFEERVEGRTLIISSIHPINYSAFCRKALIVEGGTIRIQDELDEALDRYPPRAPARVSAEQGEGALTADGDSDDAVAF